MYNIEITAERIADTVGEEHKDYILDVLYEVLGTEFSRQAIKDGMEDYES